MEGYGFIVLMRLYLKMFCLGLVVVYFGSHSCLYQFNFVLFVGLI